MKRFEEFNKAFGENKTKEEHALEMIIGEAVEYLKRYAVSEDLEIDDISVDDITAGINYYERYKKYIEWLDEEV